MAKSPVLIQVLQHLRFDVLGGSQGQKGKKKCHLDVLRQTPRETPGGEKLWGI